MPKNNRDKTNAPSQHKTNAPDQPAPPTDAVILIIRHAGQPASGAGLSPAGRQRAAAYADYFQNYLVDAQPLRLDSLIAAADTAESRRSRLTLEPFSAACRLPIDTRFKNQEVKRLARALRSRPPGRNLLICWHHEEIPALIRALGADPNWLLPGGKWPADVYDWVIQLRYDGRGYLLPGTTRRINENLMPGDDASVTGPHFI